MKTREEINSIIEEAEYQFKTFERPSASVSEKMLTALKQLNHKEQSNVLSDKQVKALCKEFLPNLLDLDSFKTKQIEFLEYAWWQGGTVVMNKLKDTQSKPVVLPEDLLNAFKEFMEFIRENTTMPDSMLETYGNLHMNLANEIEGAKQETTTECTCGLTKPYDFSEENTKQEVVKITPKDFIEYSLDQAAKKKQVVKDSECPECLVLTSQEELNMFGGLCENCTTE